MLSLELVVFCISSISLLQSVHASPATDHETHTHFNRHFNRRNYVTPAQMSASYDYVIVGGGLAGLVLASTLSDDSSKTVLVLEAGPSGDADPTKISVPAQTYYNSMLGSAPYDWVYKTVAQPNAGNRIMTQPRGKVLGGSSTVNGMYIVRPSKVEVDAWSSLIASNDQASADVWKWDNFITALKDTETFTPPLDTVQSVAGMKYQSSSHGTKGKLHTTYPAYMVPVSGTWLPSLEAAGVATSEDSDAGVNIGGAFALSSINPSNWTRSYSKSAFIDVLPPRNNLHIITDVTVERLVFADQLVNGDRVATAVQFSSGVGTPVLSVNVNKEALLCGGAFGSPHVLLLSGVGPKDVLDGAKVAVKNELPGVGQHLQDHLSVGVVFTSKVDTAGTIHASNSDFSQSAEFNSFVNSGVAYINGSRLFDGEANFATFQSTITSAAEASAASLVPSQYSPVVEGYKAIYKATSEVIYPKTGLVEILLSLNAPGQVAIQAALQQPMSHGRVYITSPSVYDNPVIDPQYFSHPADLTLLRQGIRLARTIAAQAPLKDSLGDELSPGPSVASDADIEAWLRTAVGTEFHPAGACSMLPKEQGGVVDAQLKVYGLSNVRVVDSSVFPVSWSAHMMAPTYALAEKAASVILSAASTPSGKSSSSTGSSTATGSSGSSSSTSTPKSAAVAQFSASWIALVVPFVAALLL